MAVSLVAARHRRHGPFRWTAAVSAAWTLAEAARARWPLGGYEWGQLGYIAHDLPLAAAAAIVGTLGVTALLVAGAAALVAGLTGRGAARGRWVPLAAVLGAGAALAIAGAGEWTARAGALTVGIVQVDPVCPGVASVDCPAESTEMLTRLEVGAARLIGEPDLVLWGEGALQGPVPTVAAEVRGRLGPLPAPLLAGVVAPAEPGRFLNLNVLFGRDGAVLGGYAKRHPVPFGEYVPLRALLGGVGDVGRLVPSDMAPGQAPGRVEAGGASLGTVSSWELSFAREVRAAALAGDAVVTLTNQASYGRSAVSDQLLAMAQLRARELQQAMVVAAITGQSGVVQPDGSLDAVTRLYGADELTATVPLQTGDTPYALAGDAPVVFAALLTLAGLTGPGLVARLNRRGPGAAGRG